MIHDGGIELNPVYQRGIVFHPQGEKERLIKSEKTDVVWPETKQVGLIDSLFRNFFIPPVIFAVHVNNEGEEVRICVDGKQVSPK